MIRRLAAFVLLAGDLLVGVWATLSPRGFYDSFPGLGRAWVSPDGPFNEHLVRDVGALNLALAVVALAALVAVQRFGRLAAGAHLVWAVPHVVYHGMHLDAFTTTDRVAIIGSLALGVLAALVLLLGDPPTPGEPRKASRGG